jgi:hypothetical protein
MNKIIKNDVTLQTSDLIVSGGLLVEASRLVKLTATEIQLATR